MDVNYVVHALAVFDAALTRYKTVLREEKEAAGGADHA
jgi:hypothetical protein